MQTLIRKLRHAEQIIPQREHALRDAVIQIRKQIGSLALTLTANLERIVGLHVQKPPQEIWKKKLARVVLGIEEA